MHYVSLLASILLMVSACQDAASDTPANSSAEALTLQRTVVVDNLLSPWGIDFIDKDTALISEKEGGLILANLRNGNKTMITGLPDDLVDDIRSEIPFDNGGLFDVAVDPDFAAEPWVYLSYAAKSERGRTTKVIRARLDDSRLQDIQTLLVAEPYTQDEFFHYGGGMVFDADGKLYITIGERIYNEDSNPELPIAQNPDDRRGKIYRLNPDGSVPADNPDFGPDAVPGLYAMGIRAAQGMTLHPDTGDIWFSEHGSSQGDEINRLVAGANYGWPIITTGGYRSNDYVPPEMADTDFTAPVWFWEDTVAPTGLTFYHGDEFPEWRGDLLVSGLSRGSLWRLDVEGDAIAGAEELFENDRVRSRGIAMAPDGALYMLTDTLLVPDADGNLNYTETPGGQLLRITHAE